jgi:hypothetical protein
MSKIIIAGHNTEVLNFAAWINIQHYILILCGAITQKQSDHQHEDLQSIFGFTLGKII